MSLLAFLVIVPSFLAKDVHENIAKKLPAWFPFYSVVLGLDLQGGAHILLEVDAADVARTQVEALRDDVRRILREERIRITGGIGGSGRTVQVRVPDAAERQKAVVRLRQQAQPNAANALGITSPPTFEVRESPDGLVQLVLSDSAILDRVRRAVDQTIEVIRRRVDALGTTEPNIQRQGADRVLVQVPGLQDTNRLKELLGTTARLEFRLVADPGYSPGDVDMLNEFDKDGKPLGSYPVEKRVMVQGEDLTDAQPGFDSQTQQP
jgi:preprotein translocase subunit SecD